MFLSGISLQHFRCHRQRTWQFSQPTTVIVANNAHGKTSLIEAIFLLATGDSFRASEVSEMIAFDQPLARVQGKVIEEHPPTPDGNEADDGDQAASSAETWDLEVTLTRGQLDHQKVASRVWRVNGVRRRRQDFVGKLQVVVFRPEDMRLVEGSPGRRRDFLDTMLSLNDPSYRLALKTYNEALVRRNRLLVQVREGEAPRTVLTYWTQTILKHGAVVQEKRRQALSIFGKAPFPAPYRVTFLPSIISAEHLTEHADHEIAAGHTLVGPHKDDLMVELLFDDGAYRPVNAFGSRGQQRLAVLWLKTNELFFLHHHTTQRPLLLLDDILSELDEIHRQQVLSLIGDGQTIITTTEHRHLAEIMAATGEQHLAVEEWDKDV